MRGVWVGFQKIYPEIDVNHSKRNIYIKKLNVFVSQRVMVKLQFTYESAQCRLFSEGNKYYLKKKNRSVHLYYILYFNIPCTKLVWIAIVSVFETKWII